VRQKVDRKTKTGKHAPRGERARTPAVSQERLGAHARALRLELLLAQARATLANPSAAEGEVREALAFVSRLAAAEPTKSKGNPKRIELMIALDANKDRACIGGDAFAMRGGLAWEQFIQVYPEHEHAALDGHVLAAAMLAWCAPDKAIDCMHKAEALRPILAAVGEPATANQIAEDIKKHRAMRKRRE
jgi:hypothetical protein